ncbi:MAG: hypothetical protein MK052_02820 [Alphaproteobacteria bacterium]|nr:hypothetical protein [Alphaproteobacteria bacterium]
MNATVRYNITLRGDVKKALHQLNNRFPNLVITDEDKSVASVFYNTCIVQLDESQRLQVVLAHPSREVRKVLLTRIYEYYMGITGRANSLQSRDSAGTDCHRQQVTQG